MRKSLQTLFLVAALSAPALFAAPAVVGVASAIGSFSLNNTPVSGTANVSDGASLITTSATSQVYLQNGATVSVGTNSSANIYGNKVVLNSGVTRVDNTTSSFPMVANGYRIEGTSVGTQVVARLSGNELQIASIMGAFNVYNTNGVLLRTVASGSGATFDDQSGARDDSSGTNKSCVTTAAEYDKLTGEQKKQQKKLGCAVPIGATATGATVGAGGGIVSTGTALLIVGGLLAAGVGIGLAVGLSNSGSSSPI
jgi:hypothetical protein